MKKLTYSTVLFALFSFLLSLFPINASAQGTANSRPPDFLTPPKTDKSLFFIQRNRNQNTIVYDANLLTDGSYNRSEPIDVYWIRYKSGRRTELKWVERTFAFGYSCKADGKGGFKVELSAFDSRKIHVKKDSTGKPIATIEINGKQCQLEYIWVFADDSGSWPDVIHLDIHGKELWGGKKQVERIVND